MKNAVLKIFTLLIFFGLSGCGSIIDLGQDTVADNIYNLAPAMTSQNSIDGSEKILLLGQIGFPAYVKSEKITVKPNDSEIQFLANTRWSDQASSYSMVRPICDDITCRPKSTWRSFPELMTSRILLWPNAE